jgi:hypothetical protein
MVGWRLVASGDPDRSCHQPRPIHGPQKQIWPAARIFGKRYSARRSLQQHVNASSGTLHERDQFFGNPWNQYVVHPNDQVEIATAIRSRKTGR